MISLLLPARLSRETPFQAIEISWISAGLRVPPPCILRKSPCISQKCRERRVRWGLHPPPRILANGEISWQPRNGAQLSVPGIGPIIATAIAATVVEPSGFRSGREFAAWLGLVPRQNSTGGKHRLGGISKRGNQSGHGGDVPLQDRSCPESGPPN